MAMSCDLIRPISDLRWEIYGFIQVFVPSVCNSGESGLNRP